MSSDDESNHHNDDDDDVAANDTVDPSQTGDDGKKRRKRKRKRKQATGADPEDDNDADKDPSNHEKNSDSKEREVDRTIFVEGIPYDCSRDDVSGFFQQHLKTTADSMADIRLPTWPDTGRLKGYGHVVFATRELQQAACELGNKKLYLKKRYLSIAPANAPSSGGPSTNAETVKGEPSKIIVLHNLSYDATEDDIAQVIDSSHVVTGGVRLVRHNATKRSRGFAYVEFDSVEHAEQAVAQPIVVLGRPCRVDYDHGSVQKSFRTETGRLWHKSYGGPSKKQK